MKNKSFTQEEKFLKYLGGYNLSIINFIHDGDIKESNNLTLVIDEGLPGLKQKLNYLWMNEDIYSKYKEFTNKSKVVGVSDSINNDSLGDWVVCYNSIETCKKVNQKLLALYPNDSTNMSVFHKIEFGEVSIINIRVDTIEEYIKLISKVLSVMCI